jgi:hypothetical protein
MKVTKFETYPLYCATQMTQFQGKINTRTNLQNKIYIYKYIIINTLYPTFG